MNTIIKRKKILLLLVLYVASFLLVWYLNGLAPQMAQNSLNTGVVISQLCAQISLYVEGFVWTAFALVVGFVIGVLIGVEIAKPLRVLASIVFGMVILYVPAIALAMVNGLSGFWGLLGYHGENQWTLSQIAFTANVFIVPVTVVIVAIMRTFIPSIKCQ